MLPKLRKLFVRDSHPELPIDPDVVQPGVYGWPPHFRLVFLAVVFVGGFAGTVCRYWVALQLPSGAAQLPAATLLVNLLGSFFLGLLLEGLARLGDDVGFRRLTRLGVGTGFIGGFTTYSSFAVEVYLLASQGQLAMTIVYMAVSIVGGLLSCALGIRLAAIHHKRQGA